MKECGVLLAVSSLPGPYGIGCMDQHAYAFAKKLQAAKQKYWQILPLGITGYGDSPYQSFSTFAGNPYLIGLDALVEAGWLTKEDIAIEEYGDVDYEKLYQTRYPLLRKAYQASAIAEDADFQKFCEDAWWLHDYALFMALKSECNGASWDQWPEAYRMRDPEALKAASQRLHTELEFHQFLQYVFWKQWHALKTYVNTLGIEIIGDIPIYVAYDSADVWAHPELFQLDENKLPVAVAGCPPDGFSADGQLWGNPLYQWKNHDDSGYAWWISRMHACAQHYDVIRIDHFRGFDEYFSIPYGASNAAGGHWEQGPGMRLFEAIRQALPDVRVIAEDLGFLSDSVIQLVKDSGFPGMKVLQFGFDARDENGAAQYQPHNYTNHCVAYTGTHDNETMMGWFDSITPEERSQLRSYVDCWSESKEDLLDACIEVLLLSEAQLCIVPMQDYLKLGNEARMNCPNTLGANWKWRMKPQELDETLIQHMKEVCEQSNRG